MKKCLILLLMLLMCLSGCGTLSQSDEISIVLLHGWGTMEEDNQAMREIYSEFEKDNPDISLKMISMPSPENVTSKVKEMISVGKLPNLIYIGETGIDTLYSFMVTQGYVIDIMPYIEKDKEFQSMIAPETLMKWKTADGKLVPVIFRPWHEMSGGWFWWGTKSCTAEEIKKLYQLTFDVLSKEYHLKNIVWAYSPNSGYDDFMKYYPGDQYVDLLGIDIYDFEADNNKYQSNLRKDLNLLQSLGKMHHKLIAITETGAQQLPDDQWFTKVFWPVVSQYPISYVLFWRNAWDNHKETYISYPGAPSEPDFKKFASFNRTLFVNDIKE